MRVEQPTRLWRLPGGELIRSQSWKDAERRGCQYLRFFPKDRLTVGITTNGTVHLWDLATGAHQKAIPLGGSGFVPQRLSSDHRWLLGTTRDMGILVLCDLWESQRVANFAFGWVICYAAAFSPDNRWLAFSTIDRFEAIKVWDLSARQLKQTLLSLKYSQTFGALAMAYSPDGKVLACGGYSGEIRLWSTATGIPIEPTLKGHNVAVGRLAFSADGKTLASGGGDLNIRLWNVATRQEMLLLPDAFMTSGENRLITDAHYAGQAELTPGDRWMLWQEQRGPIRVTQLPSLAETDAIDKSRGQQP